MADDEKTQQAIRTDSASTSATNAATTFATCPNCGVIIDLFEKNCKIVRCGGTVDPVTGRFKQFPPHGSEANIRALIDKSALHYGCGRPLRWIDASQSFILTTWDT